ncbi:histidine phosphatase family protein [Citricoccus nitrophenolicus]|uniref:histidine phosphatase family protein n=1 Tax=Citricoccus nitrophenolicus TaxID=863575 RepID=UPI0031F04AEA
MRLYLIRHGQTTSNVGRHLDTQEPGASLTDLGRQQAAAVPEALSGLEIEAIYASTLVRTQQTAEPLARELGLEVQIRDGLREVPAGGLEMKNDEGSIHTYLSTILGWADGGGAVPLPGTSMTGDEVLGRFDEVVGEVFGTGVAAAAVFSHGAVLRAWTAARSENVTPEFAARTPVENTGVIVVSGAPGRWRAERWQEHALGGGAVDAGEDGAAAEAVGPEEVRHPSRRG